MNSLRICLPKLATAVLLALGLATSLQPLESGAMQAESTSAEAATMAQVNEPAPRAKTRPTNKAKRKQEALAKQQARQLAEQREADERERLKADKVKDLLAKAQRDYAEGRLIEPAINNAAARYREALTLDPTQLEALAGAKRIVAVIAGEAEHAAASGDLESTRRYIAVVRTLLPDDPTLLELEARANALMSSPVVFSSRQQERYNRSAQSIERAYAALKAQPLDMQALDAAIDEYDRAVTLAARAPGLPMLKDRILVAFPAATRAELASDNAKRALKVVQMARQRGWFNPELELLEGEAKEASASRQ
jgi:hypothetical protein